MSRAEVEVRWALVIDPNTAIASKLLLTYDYPKTNQSIKNVEKYIYLNFDNARKMDTWMVPSLF